MNALAKTDDTKLYESLALRGDLSALSPQDKARYYASLCERLEIDPTTQPFVPLKMNGKEILYASRGCTDQLARKHHVDRQIIKEEEIRGAYVVTVEATLPNGRREQSKGAVAVEGLKGDAFCNAIMKAETKAKRRATLSILGLGLLDETELETIPAYRRAEGEVIDIPVEPTVEAEPEPATVEAEPTEELTLEAAADEARHRELDRQLEVFFIEEGKADQWEAWTAKINLYDRPLSWKRATVEKWRKQTAKGATR